MTGLGCLLLCLHFSPTPFLSAFPGLFHQTIIQKKATQNYHFRDQFDGSSKPWFTLFSLNKIHSGFWDLSPVWNSSSDYRRFQPPSLMWLFSSRSKKKKQTCHLGGNMQIHNHKCLWIRITDVSYLYFFLNYLYFPCLNYPRCFYMLKAFYYI